MQVYFGARGVTDLEITLFGPARPLHSGHYGNWAPNPAVELAHLVAGLRDEDGRIQVAGFYDDVRPPTETEKQALREVPDVDEALRGELALARTEAGGARLVERILLPALNVRGLASGGVGDAGRQRHPHARPARRSTSAWCRTRRRRACARRSRPTCAGSATTSCTSTPAAGGAAPPAPRWPRLAWGPGYPAARTSMDLPVSRALVPRRRAKPAAAP